MIFYLANCFSAFYLLAHCNKAMVNNKIPLLPTNGINPPTPPPPHLTRIHRINPPVLSREINSPIKAFHPLTPEVAMLKIRQQFHICFKNYQRGYI